jgi:lipopolysaccharide assembly outer membrane protein LptD (OstA)
MLILSTGLQAQERRFKNDSLTVKPVQSVLDSLRAQSLQPRTDSTTTKPLGTDTLKVMSNGIETTIVYYAEDSIITKTATNVTYLYGNAYIQYGKIKLDAAEIEINRNTNELVARGVQDSTGSWIGLPIFEDGGGVYETRGIRYNFETNKAKITGVVTQQDQGFLSGEAIKKNPDGSAYISGGKFIPCNDLLATTYIKAKKIKVIPGDKVITGPFLLYIGGIPTIFGLPFGFFPETNSNQTSGILFPKYGEERNRGIFLDPFIPKEVMALVCDQLTKSDISTVVVLTLITPEIKLQKLMRTPWIQKIFGFRGSTDLKVVGIQGFRQA